MPDGKPDLQGVWFGGGFGLTVSANPSGLRTRPTPKPGLEASLRIVNDPYEVGAGCGVRSVPVYYGPGYRFQIVQTPTTVVQLIERMHLHRIFQIGAEHSDDVMNGEELTFLGDSVARWDGDTLVVDTRGFNLKTAVGTDEGAFTGGFKHSPKLHLVERIRRIDYDTLEIESTLEDPDLFNGPWRLVTRHGLRPEFQPHAWVHVRAESRLLQAPARRPAAGAACGRPSDPAAEAQPLDTPSALHRLRRGGA